MSQISGQAFRDFDALSELFARTRSALDGIMRRGRADAEASSILADRTLPHIEDVEAGFKARLRTAESDVSELRTLIHHGGLSVPAPRGGPEARAALIEAMQALSGAGGTRQLVPAAGSDLAATEHARIAMALLPHTSPAAVHYPGRASYADIATPRTPGEFVARIEEVERTIWLAATGRRARLRDPAWRRVYAFFDAGQQLSADGLHPS